MELSFCNLKSKDVINVCDGRNLGNITDIIFDTCCGRIQGIVIPNSKSFFNFFKSSNDIFIPYNHICKIGKDIILVDIIIQDNCNTIKSQCSNEDFKNNENNNNYNIKIKSFLDNINK